LAGNVEGRILTAARGVFVESGFGGASIDEVARRSRASKPTIYGRYPTKEALLVAVIAHAAPTIDGQHEDLAPSGKTLEEGLTGVGMMILTRLLNRETIDFMRLAAAETQRIPELVAAGRSMRERAARAARRPLAAVAAVHDISRYPALAEARLEMTTQVFLDIVVSRSLLRALLGEPLDDLLSEIATQVPRSVVVFLAACRD
jgi:AcrR family transcriptional regulator